MATHMQTPQIARLLAIFSVSAALLMAVPVRAQERLAQVQDTEQVPQEGPPPSPADAAEADTPEDTGPTNAPLDANTADPNAQDPNAVPMAPPTALDDPGEPAGAPRSDAEVAPLTEAETALLAGDRGWPAGSVRRQLDRDSTLLPYGKGAIFVPAMVNGLDEPPVTVWRGNDKLVDGTTGARIILSPGEYFVEMGSGTVETRFGRTVHVHELKTTVVPVLWSGLTVHVVDPQLNSLRQPYEIIRMSDREYIGAGFGVDERLGETLATWVLQPGLYKLVRVGGTYRDRQDFATLRLVPGAHTHYLLVLDSDTGQFRGAGEARPEELFRSDQGTWTSFILGGNASMNDRHSVVGFPNGQGWAIAGFVDTKLNLRILDNPFVARLQITEGQTALPNQVWQKISDNVQLDLLYIYHYKPWAGPYARATATTNFFGTTVRITPSTVTVTDASTKRVTTNYGVSNVRLTPPFGQISAREGAGMNFRVLKILSGEINLRTGLGYQQTLNRDLLQQVSPNNYVRLASGTQFGVDATVIAIGRITRWVVINGVVEALIPFDRRQKVSLNIEGTVALKLSQFAAINYVVHYTSGPLYPQAVLENDVLLRFSVELI